MTSPVFFHQDPQLNIVLELLNRTQGKEFVVLSGMLRRPSSAEGIQVTHNCAKVKAFSEEEFLNNEIVKKIIFHAFYSGNLGTKDAQRRYAFNEKRSNEFKEAGVKTIIVTNTPQGEQIDQDASFDTISDELYLMLLEQLIEMSKNISKNDSEKTKDPHQKSIDLRSRKESASPRRESQAFIKTSSRTKREKSREIDEETRSDNRERVKSAQKKDQRAFEKRQKYIILERLKEEIKSSSLLQNLIKNGEINEALFFKLIEKAEISESLLFKLLEIAAIDALKFLQLFKDPEISKNKFVNKIENLHKKLYSKSIT